MRSLILFTENLSEKNSNKLSYVFEHKLLNNHKNLRITKPYQYFGIWIAHNLNDLENIPVYIKLAKEQERTLLESALSYVKDYPNAKSKAKLFFWYLKGKLRKTSKTQSKTKSRKKNECELVLCPNKKVRIVPNNVRDISLKTITRSSVKRTTEYKDKALSVVKWEKDVCFGVYKLDYYCRTNKIGIDLVENSVHKSLSATTYITKKRSFLESLGIKYLRIDKENIAGDVEKYLIHMVNSF
jgi:very-short-patch-repair endonuclease